MALALVLPTTIGVVQVGIALAAHSQCQKETQNYSTRPAAAGAPT